MVICYVVGVYMYVSDLVLAALGPIQVGLVNSHHVVVRRVLAMSGAWRGSE